MKKCPACGKEFEDSMRFCQIDGTQLVAVDPPLDPYATMVGHKLDLTPSEPAVEESSVESAPTEESYAVEIPVEKPTDETSPAAPVEKIVVEPLIHETSGSVPIAEPDEGLELPGADPLKTMYVSESEMKEVFGAEEQANEAAAEEPIVVEPAAPEPPSFGAPDVPATGFDAVVPPPSPFSIPEEPIEALPPFEHAETETVLAQEASSPFREPEPAPVAEWTPPLVPDPVWQNQQNMPIQPVPAVAGGPSKGLAIGSLVCGILSCTICCSLGLFLGPAAAVMGFIAKKKADESPSEFSGRGMALGGMITGVIGFLIGITIIILQVVFGALGGFLGSLPN